MVATNDGFEIAEADLKLRGPGDIQGTRQSGMLDFHIANLAKDGEMIARTRQIAIGILNDDPRLQKPENKLLNREMRQRFKGKRFGQGFRDYFRFSTTSNHTFILLPSSSTTVSRCRPLGGIKAN